jgi:CRISPR-associated protein (TIGR02584 family)
MRTTTMQAPHEYPRRILLVVTGLSPQVVTETLWALAVGAPEDGRFVPTEIHVLTTSRGAEHIRLQLLSEDRGWFRRLLEDYSLPAITFDVDHIHVVEDANAEPLSDIRDEADSQAVGDFIMDWTRRLTADDQAAVHASIAGGRKTMGFYLGYAMSLFGREQDRLSHVLVESPYESLSEFFYPAPRERVIIDRNNEPQDAAKARVWLADIPFVRLREGIPKRLLEGRSGFAETIAVAQRALQPPSLEVDFQRGRLVIAGEPVELPPAEFAFYAMMARRRAAGKHAMAPQDLDPAEYLPEHERIPHAQHDRIRALFDEWERAEIMDAMDVLQAKRDWFDQRRSRANAVLRDTLGEALAKPYLIHAHGQRPKTRYGLTLDPEAIRIVDSQ